MSSKIFKRSEWNLFVDENTIKTKNSMVCTNAVGEKREQCLSRSIKIYSYHNKMPDCFVCQTISKNTVKSFIARIQLTNKRIHSRLKMLQDKFFFCPKSHNANRSRRMTNSNKIRKADWPGLRNFHKKRTIAELIKGTKITHSPPLQTENKYQCYIK